MLLSTAGRAETVSVEHVGNVDLSRFDCTPITESKLLHRVCYDEAHQYVLALVGDEYQEACDIKPKTMDGLFDAENVAAYYNRHMRGRHKCTPGTRPNLSAQ